MKIALDKVSSILDSYAVKQLIDQGCHWGVFTLDSPIGELKAYANNLLPRNKGNLEGLSNPQLIVLYGKLWEKEILPEHLKEVEELINGQS
jgi:hypothetical protein